MSPSACNNSTAVVPLSNRAQYTSKRSKAIPDKVNEEGNAVTERIEGSVRPYSGGANVGDTPIAVLLLLVMASFVLGCISKYVFAVWSYEEQAEAVPKSSFSTAGDDSLRILLGGDFVGRRGSSASTKDDLRERYSMDQCSPSSKRKSSAVSRFLCTNCRFACSNNLSPLLKVQTRPTDNDDAKLDFEWERYHRSTGEGAAASQKLRREEVTDELYYEAMVHPGMFAHPDPQRVALVGLGSDSYSQQALIEVLKHETVVEVELIGPGDQSTTGAAFLHDNDHCVEGSDGPTACAATKHLKNDSRWSVLYNDTLLWLPKDNTGLTKGCDYDVVIVDLEPLQSDVWLGLLQLAHDSLSKEGVMVVPLGAPPNRHDLAIGSKKALDGKYYARVIDAVTQSEFETFSIYDEPHGRRGREKKAFLVACLDDCVFNFYSNEAEVNTMIHNRIRGQGEDVVPFKLFDGATMSSYLRPCKAWEAVYCGRNPTPVDCLHMNGFDPNIPNAPSEMFEVKVGGVTTGRGVFAARTIPAGSYIMQETVPVVQFPPKTADTLEKVFDNTPEADALAAILAYIFGYGYESWVLGDIGHFADSGISTFTNHGCNGTYNTVAVNLMSQMSREALLSEENADPTNMPWEEEEGEKFNPIMQRHMENYWMKSQRAIWDIPKGDEVVENYLFFVQSEVDWATTLRALKAQCSGEDLGVIGLADSNELVSKVMQQKTGKRYIPDN